MKRHINNLILGLVVCSIGLTGCDSEANKELRELRRLESAESETRVTRDYNLSQEETDQLLYSQVTDRQLLNLNSLVACDKNLEDAVVQYMANVNKQLIGDVEVIDYADDNEKATVESLGLETGVIDTSLTDYLLTFMCKTPYYWQRSKTTIRGMDSQTRSIVVDVTYKTIDFKKTVEADSMLTKGDPNYEKKAKTRYSEWTNILNNKAGGHSDSVQFLESDFVSKWGNPADIFNSQRSVHLTSMVHKTKNQLTSSGLLKSDVSKSNGEMTVRYVLVPNYALGINLGLKCEHLYITDYKLDDDVTSNLKAFEGDGYVTLRDSVYNLIYSYFTCIDENDFKGLYKLTNGFSGLDKYYTDVFSSTYQKHDGFTLTIYDIKGTHIKCGVTISTKERAKGSNMSYPLYTDKYYVEVDLSGDILKVSNLVHVNRVLEGEPAISGKEADIAGFNNVVSLKNEDKVAIEKLICDFGVLQLAKNTKDDSFGQTVDTSLSEGQLAALTQNMSVVSGVKKAVYLGSYVQGTSNFASVKCTELFATPDKTIVEAQTTYEFISKGGKWYVYNYDVNNAVTLDTKELVTADSLCVVTPEKVETYESQLKNSVEQNLDDVKDISVVIEHESYIPKANEGTDVPVATDNANTVEPTASPTTSDAPTTENVDSTKPANTF